MKQFEHKDKWSEAMTKLNENFAEIDQRLRALETAGGATRTGYETESDSDLLNMYYEYRTCPWRKSEEFEYQTRTEILRRMGENQCR